jgi:hypothetical protein
MSEANETEKELFSTHPPMFRSHPVWFLISIALCFAGGIGIIILIILWIWTRGSKLTVTTKRTTLRAARHIRNRCSIRIRYATKHRQYAIEVLASVCFTEIGIKIQIYKKLPWVNDHIYLLMPRA